MGDKKYYGDPDMVIGPMNLEPRDFGLKGQEQLLKIIEKWLAAAKSYIDTDRRRSYDQNTPPGIENIAERIAMNMAGFARQRQGSHLVRVGEYNIQMVEDRIISDSIRQDLNAFPKGIQFAMGISNRLTRKEEEGGD